MPLMMHHMAHRLADAFTGIELLALTLGKPVDYHHIIDSLSDYMHLASHTHLFERGNVSLFMSHVNYALERAGLSPVQHGGLDLLAMRKHFDDFRPHFWDAVATANPQAQLSINTQIDLAGIEPKTSTQTVLHSGLLTTETAGEPKGITSLAYQDNDKTFGVALFIKATLHTDTGETTIWLQREGQPEYGNMGNPNAPKAVFRAVAVDGQAFTISTSSSMRISLEGLGRVEEPQSFELG